MEVKDNCTLLFSYCLPQIAEQDLNGIMNVGLTYWNATLGEIARIPKTPVKRTPSKRMTGLTNPSQHRRKQWLVEWPGKSVRH